jgi:hypothetical protein
VPVPARGANAADRLREKWAYEEAEREARQAEEVIVLGWLARQAPAFRESLHLEAEALVRRDIGTLFGDSLPDTLVEGYVYRLAAGALERGEAGDMAGEAAAAKVVCENADRDDAGEDVLADVADDAEPGVVADESSMTVAPAHGPVRGWAVPSRSSDTSGVRPSPRQETAAMGGPREARGSAIDTG